MTLNVESLARELHEAAREAVAKNLVVRADVPTKGFIEWDNLTPEAKEGRLIQARFLLERFTVAPRITGLDGLAPGRIVHFVLHNGEHRAAIVTAVPGQQVKTMFDGGQMNEVQNASSDSGIISLTVFTTPQDDQNRYNQREPDVMRVAGATFDPTGQTPNTWHWMERA